MEDHHEDGFGELVNTQDHGVVQMLPQGILVANHEGVEVGQNGQGQKGQHGHHNEQRRVQAALEIELNQDIVTDQGGANQQGDEPDGSGLLEILPKGGKKVFQMPPPVS